MNLFYSLQSILGTLLFIYLLFAAFFIQNRYWAKRISMGSIQVLAGIGLGAAILQLLLLFINIVLTLVQFGSVPFAFLISYLPGRLLNVVIDVLYILLFFALFSLPKKYTAIKTATYLNLGLAIVEVLGLGQSLLQQLIQAIQYGFGLSLSFVYILNLLLSLAAVVLFFILFAAGLRGMRQEKSQQAPAAGPPPAPPRPGEQPPQPAPWPQGQPAGQQPPPPAPAQYQPYQQPPAAPEWQPAPQQPSAQPQPAPAPQWQPAPQQPVAPPPAPAWQPAPLGEPQPADVPTPPIAPQPEAPPPAAPAGEEPPLP